MLTELKDDFEAIIADFNKLNMSIVNRYIPNDPGRKEGRTYEHLSRKVDALQMRMLEWRAAAFRYMSAPNIVVASIGESDRDMVLLLENRALNLITTLRSDLSIYQSTLASNHQIMVSTAVANKSFTVAMRAYYITAAGLVAAVIGILMAL
ncbi:hypothetical protein B1759_16580 [Rubrivirga sp. SAORIC476]|nr:hypothetical protein B1759_16580 [Rubrivirga sp. SAORIC476]